MNRLEPHSVKALVDMYQKKQKGLKRVKTGESSLSFLSLKKGKTPAVSKMYCVSEIYNYCFIVCMLLQCLNHVHLIFF